MRILSTKAPWRNDPNLTSFQRKVYEAVSKIPPGKVVTYKNLALSVHCKSSQAVGQALRRNPYAPIVPCHRVVKSDLTMGGFFGHTTGKPLERKMELLRDEGVCVDSASGKIEPISVYDLSSIAER